MNDEDETKAWEKLNEDKDIRSWLKWHMPHYSESDITKTIYAVVIIAISLGLLFFALNMIAK